MSHSVLYLQALPKLQKLKVINFGDCLVRNNGAKALATAIRDGQIDLEVFMKTNQHLFIYLYSVSMMYTNHSIILQC